MNFTILRVRHPTPPRDKVFSESTRPLPIHPLIHPSPSINPLTHPSINQTIHKSINPSIYQPPQTHRDLHAPALPLPCLCEITLFSLVLRFALDISDLVEINQTNPDVLGFHRTRGTFDCYFLFAKTYRGLDSRSRIYLFLGAAWSTNCLSPLDHG